MTTYTPPVSPIANELPIGSSVTDFTVPLARSIVPSTPPREANHSRPLQSGSAEMMPSPDFTCPVRSKSCSTTGSPSVLMTNTCRVVVGTTARSSWPR